MEVGLALPQLDYAAPGGGLAWPAVLGWAREAERLGFRSLWLADHAPLPPGGTGPPFAYDPLVALGALARHTRRVTLGTLVLSAPMRPPRLLARQLATLHDLAGGRLVAGVGTGPPGPGGAGGGTGPLAEVLDVLAGGPAPRWVGGAGDRLLDVVAAGGAEGWNVAWRWTPAAYRERVAALERACRRHGRDPATVVRSVGLATLVGEDEADLARRYRRLQEGAGPGVLDGTSLEEWRAGGLVGTVDQVRAELSHWRSLGVSQLIAGLGAIPFSAGDPGDLQLLASAIL